MCFLIQSGIDKGVNKNPNNLITNKTILEIEKPNWSAESILLATLNIQEFTVLENEETGPYFSFKIDQTIILKESSNAPMIQVWSRPSWPT